eukprot:148523-Rhodomonas_salina.3
MSSDDEDNNKSETLSLVARYLSFIAYENMATPHTNATITVKAEDFWDKFKFWAKRNNHKMKMNATEFATEVVQTVPNCIEKKRQDFRIYFEFSPTKLHDSLANHNMLDQDVW